MELGSSSRGPDWGLTWSPWTSWCWRTYAGFANASEHGAHVLAGEGFEAMAGGLSKGASRLVSDT